ncbi:MAG: beta-N-acetylhexosaminidase [Bacteroidaceae bacterium]|nr:beta-N-acetylhexosaminidase [Bacteroidaceae bacterium]
MRYLYIRMCGVGLLMLLSLCVTEVSAEVETYSNDALPGMQHLLPMPHKVKAGTGQPFALGRPVKIVSDFEDVDLLAEVFTDELGCTLSEEATAQVTVTKVASIAGASEPILAGFDNEAYTLRIDGDAIAIRAISRLGVIRAAQTLAQLGEGDGGHSKALECVNITDWAAFKVRGFMHDVGRSFISFEELKQQVKLLSRYKLNFFQWHMTENQAWRFAVEAYPQLTASGNMTRFAGQYYTQEQCRELDALGHKYGVYIVPEIDMPGHSQAFSRAMGHDMQTTQGMKELKVILNEVIACFPHAPYIHLGGDERDIKTIDGENFLTAMSKYVHSKGQRVMWWSPTENTTVSKDAGCDMAQVWSYRGKQIKGLPCIECRYTYSNHFDVFADIAGVYRSTFLRKTKGDSETAGVISCPWNDRKTPTEEDILVQNNIFAVGLATGERAWRGGGKAYIEEVGAVIPNSGEEYDDFKNWEQRFLFHKAHSLSAEPIPYVKQTNVRWRLSDPINNGGEASKSFPEWENCKALESEMPENVSISGQKYGWTLATGAGICLHHHWGAWIPGIWGTNQQTGQTTYAYTYIYNPDEERTVGAQIEFQNYSRAEKDKAPNNGKWDYKGSDIWLNGERIAPPTWQNAGKSISLEKDLANENFTARKPLIVTLRKGWNKVFIKLPYVEIDASTVRVNKWQFTFVLTDTEGKNAIEGLIYSPTKTLTGEEPEPEQEDRSPKISDANKSYYYALHTPGRDNRYATSRGVGSVITGDEQPSAASYWKFVQRADGSLDIVNYADASFVSSTADSGSGLTTVSAAPAKGWKLLPANKKDHFIIVSGTTEWNQSNENEDYKVLNWGYGSRASSEYNLNDSGCQYQFIFAKDISDEEGINNMTEPNKNGLLSPASNLKGKQDILFDLQGRPSPSAVHAPLNSHDLFIKNGRKMKF